MGIVYVLTNQAMPGYVKIGITEDLGKRMSDFYTTGVPFPFECYYAGDIEDASSTEKAIHEAFDDYRANPKREFFEIDPYKAKVILELVATNDVTPKNEIVESPEDEEALGIAQAKNAKKPFRFSRANVPVGATLVFGRKESETAEVADDKSIIFRGEMTSLSAAALTILDELGFNWTAVRGPAEWLYQGQSLSELEAEAEVED